MANILLVVASYLPERIDGTVLATRELARCYAKLGHVVTIVCREMGGIDAYQPLGDAFEPTIRHDRQDGLAVARLSVPRERNFIQSLDHPDVNILFTQLLDTGNVDAVHIHHLEHLSTEIPALCHARAIPCVYTLHDFYTACPTVQLITNGGRLCDGPDGGRKCAKCMPAMPKVVGERRSLPGVFRLRRMAHAYFALDRPSFEQRHHVMQHLLKSPVQLISPSHYLADKLIQVSGLPLNIRVIRNGAPAHTLDIRERPAAVPVIGYMGVVGHAKGLHLLTRALQGLTTLPWKLEVHGRARGSYANDCRIMLPDDRVSIMGGYLPDHAAQILNRLDLLVVPSVWPENCPLVILQALAAGVPCLVAGWGGMPELVTEHVNGLYFTPLQADSLQARLSSLLSNPALLKQLAAGAASTRLASWDEVAEQYLDILLPQVN